MVSNLFAQPAGKPDPGAALPAGTVHPASIAARLGEVQVIGERYTPEMMALVERA